MPPFSLRPGDHPTPSALLGRAVLLGQDAATANAPAANKYKGGRPKTFTLPERRDIKNIAKSKPTEHDLPFSTWSVTKLADSLSLRGWPDDIRHEGLRILLREEGVAFQRLKTWTTSTKSSFCTDEFGPLNLMPHPGRQCAGCGGKHKNPDREPRRRRRATYNRHGGVRHLFARPGLESRSALRTHQAVVLMSGASRVSSRNPTL
jgi:hypothetical protein